MALSNVFVTVGTTSFDELIKEVTSDRVLERLRSRGCKRLVLQVADGLCKVNERDIAAEHGIRVECYVFKDIGIQLDIMEADLVIGHAGAGTCMDILEGEKPGLIVINDSLMDNHQVQLAQQLNDEGYVRCCSVNELADVLETIDIKDFKRFKSMANVKEFVKCFEDLILATEDFHN